MRSDQYFPHQESGAGTPFDHAGGAPILRRPIPDPAVVDSLIESNLSFVVRVANDYRDRGVPFEDLLNEGNLGLIEAARRFDASKGVKFITYAVWWIRKSILRAVHDHGRVVRIPEYQRKQLGRFRDAESALRTELGRRPDSQEISDRLSRSLAAVERVRQMHLREVSLDDPVRAGEDTRYGESFADFGVPSPEEALIRSEALRLVGVALSSLTARERQVLDFRYGFGGGSGLSLVETGKLLGLSGERVRQIEAVALDRIRKNLRIGRIASAPSRRPRAAANLLPGR